MAEQAPCPSLPAPHYEVDGFHSLYHAAYGNFEPDDTVDLDRLGSQRNDRLDLRFKLAIHDDTGPVFLDVVAFALMRAA
jgi:hypothetical protein